MNKEQKEIQGRIDYCKSQIEEHERAIARIKENIAELEEKKLAAASVKDIFKGIIFRSYAQIGDVQGTYMEAVYRYNLHKGKEGLDEEFRKIQEKFVRQVIKHIDHQRSYNRPFDKKLPEREKWNDLFEKEDERNRVSYLDKYRSDYNEEHSAEHMREVYFYADPDCWSYWHENIETFDLILREIEFLNGTEDYKKIKNVLDNLKLSKQRLEEFNAKGEKLFEEFKEEWHKFYVNRQAEYKAKQEEKKRQEERRRENQNRRYSEYYSLNNEFFKGSYGTEKELKTKYRELCMKLHPDKGGDEETFKRMQKEYEKMKESLFGKVH